MLIEKTKSEIKQTAPAVDAVVPLASSIRLRARNVGFRAMSLADVDTLTEFYSGLDDPLGDLNPLAMIAWRRVLDLHLLIEDEVLYVLANWEGGPMLWGPPIGKGISIDHVRRAFQLLRELDPSNSEPVIAYLWKGYPLWRPLIASDDLIVIREGTEYIYDVNRIATLAGGDYKKKRRDYIKFRQAYNPAVVEYSRDLAPDCLRLLNKWRSQKRRMVAGDYLQKLLAECKACQDALTDQIPLTGVVAIINHEVEAFSIGAAHGPTCFSCIFEKTNLELPRAPTLIFSELAKKCVGQYRELASGEDWHINYLAFSRRLWKPLREQPSYYLTVHQKP